MNGTLGRERKFIILGGGGRGVGGSGGVGRGLIMPILCGGDLDLAPTTRATLPRKAIFGRAFSLGALDANGVEHFVITLLHGLCVRKLNQTRYKHAHTADSPCYDFSQLLL